MPGSVSLPRQWRSSSALISAAGAVLIIAAGCNSTPPAPATPAPPPAKTESERATLYVNGWKLYNDKSWEAFADLYTPGATFEQPDQAPTVTGRQAIVDFIKAEAPVFPDRHGVPQLVLVNGAHIAAIAMWGGTHEGPLPMPDGKSLPATHKKIALLLGNAIDLDDSGSHIVREAIYADQPTMLSQMGLTKMPVRPATMPADAPPTIVTASHDAKETANVALFRAAADAVAKHDATAFAGMLAENYTLIDNTQPKDMNKKAAVASIAEYTKAFPDIALNPTTIWGAGDYVVAEGTFTGTNTGDMPSMGVKKTGKKVSVRFIEIVKIENGKVTSDWTLFNGGAFATQLGMK